ncbi:DUF3558 domain-containing protein [Nocardia kruczakiae]|uniref:DUF3558 domain-containing protein n=1 Tax=Nocardia kruczakiae TaxID=261477 RepID=UPI000A019084|nr:DUF3558 domain-containing protein [Nocardia kruczakiae]
MRGDQREASVIRKAATAVLAAAAVLVGAGCSSSTSGTASPETSDPKVATAALWDPCTQVTDDVLRQAGMDPATRAVNIGGVPVDGWKLCSWHDNPDYYYTLGVWSSIFTIDDLKKKSDNIDFQEVTVAGRKGFQYRTASDKNGTNCYVAFPGSRGTFEVSMYNMSSRAAEPPCSHAISAASALVPLFPS